MMVLALPVTLVFAVGSWALVESPALSRRHRIGLELTNRFTRRPAHDAAD
jgi:peptidoglycan/LPS O-acetylase OafA/YrhL